MLLNDIVATSAQVARSAGRLAKVALLRSLLLRLPPDEIPIAINFLAGLLRQGRIGIGPSRLYRVGAPSAQTPTLTLSEVDQALSRIHTLAGAGSARERAAVLAELFGRATAQEQGFLIRLLLGELRQGALEGVMVEALAQAAALPLAEVRRAAMVSGDLAVVAQAALTGGRASLTSFAVTLFQPIAPMLAQPAAGIEEALQRLGEADFQWKLDGARIQLHKEGRRIKVFSRNLNDVTSAVPELVEEALLFAADTLILDGEALALRPDGSPHPFQTTMRRFGRRLEVAQQRRLLTLSPFYFDCLYLEGESLLDLQEKERFRRMAAVLPPQVVIPHLVSADTGEAAAFFADVVGRGHEGVMAKGTGSCYESGRRGYSWLKLKPVQTLDLVVLAAEWGHGRRRGLLSNLHLGARDPGSGGYVVLGKTFKGLTDAMLAFQTERLLALELSRDALTVYVAPALVVEVAFSDIQSSPRYPGGFALRFARVKRYRLDKSASEADTVTTVAALYQAQTKLGKKQSD